MEKKCKGFWEMCECEDCLKVGVLYAELDYYEQFEPDNILEIMALKKQIEDMGYFV